MKAWRFQNAFGLENLACVEFPDPQPGPGQAVVRVRACSLNYRDLVVSKGGYGKAVKPPLTPLSDGAGEVIAVGPGVTRVKPGDRVAAIFMHLKSEKWTIYRFLLITVLFAIGLFLLTALAFHDPIRLN